MHYLPSIFDVLNEYNFRKYFREIEIELCTCQDSKIETRSHRESPNWSQIPSEPLRSGVLGGGKFVLELAQKSLLASMTGSFLFFSQIIFSTVCRYHTL
jgi:hypothetical protein